MTPQPVVYAIADTHLGLRERGGERHRDEPAVVADFFRWLARLPEGGYTIPTWEHSEFQSRTLQPVSHLILLGDIIELWDSENHAVMMSTVPVAETLRELDARKVYVLGNHDNILETVLGTYPFGNPGLEVVGEVYPPPDPSLGVIRPLEIGGRGYVFIHGHQCDPLFIESFGAWRVLGHLRQAGAALGSWSWALTALSVAVLVTQILLVPGPWGWFLFATLFLLSFPRLYMQVGRGLAARLGSRYDRAAALKGFASWWAGFQRQIRQPSDLAVVFGHTHYLDVAEIGAQPSGSLHLPKVEKVLADTVRATNGRRLSLFNLSAWISSRGAHKDVVRATILYADETSPLVLGWDWERHRPFHIPEELIAKRRRKWRLDPGEVAIAQRLDWPAKLLQKWMSTDEAI